MGQSGHTMTIMPRAETKAVMSSRFWKNLIMAKLEKNCPLRCKETVIYDRFKLFKLLDEQFYELKLKYKCSKSRCPLCPTFPYATMINSF